MAGQHIIGKQIWEIDVPSSGDAYAIQQQVSNLFWKELLPELELSFDQIAGPESVIRLDTLEVDISTDDLSASSVEVIVQAVLKAIKDACSGFGVGESRVSYKGSLKQESAELISLHMHSFETWIHWLRTGCLPPYCTSPGSEWTSEVWEAIALEYRAVETLRRTLKNSPLALKRLVLQHTQKDLLTLLEIVSGQDQGTFVSVARELQALRQIRPGALQTYSLRDIEIELWETALKEVILQGSKLSGEALVDFLLLESPLRHFADSMDTHPNKWQAAFPEFSKGLARIRSRQHHRDSKAHLESEADAAGMSKEAMYSQQAPGPEEQTETPQFFANAGVVLIHPFLPNLFKRMQLMKGSDFRNESCRARAVLLLQYLASGNEKTQDHALVLPKFLCGMPANWPVDHTISLTKTAKQRADQMLQAAIDHWGALGTTSPDGLRSGFLMREGKLTHETGKRKLVVEQRAMDILLDRLPWNLSLIKLPWMQEILYVEWR